MKTNLIKPIALLLCAALALAVCLTGCGGSEPNFPVPLSDTTRSAIELNTESLKDADLEAIFTFMQEGNSVTKLNDQYKICCLRKTDDGYSVLYWGTKNILVLRFDTDGKWIEADRLHSIYRMTGSRVKLDALKVGDNVVKVQQADATCYFPFLADKESTELETNHYTEDGYHTCIRYDADFNITSVTYELM